MDVATSICVGFDLTPRLAQLSHLELLGKQQPKRCGASVLIEISKAREVQMVRRPTTFASKNGRTGGRVQSLFVHESANFNLWGTRRRFAAGNFDEFWGSYSREFYRQRLRKKRSHSSASFLTRWWFQTLFSPLFGEMIQFDKQIFQMGWLNHEAAYVCSDGFPGEGARELPGKKCCSPLASYCTPSATTDPWWQEHKTERCAWLMDLQSLNSKALTGRGSWKSKIFAQGSTFAVVRWRRT